MNSQYCFVLQLAKSLGNFFLGGGAGGRGAKKLNPVLVHLSSSWKIPAGISLEFQLQDCSNKDFIFITFL